MSQGSECTPDLGVCIGIVLFALRFLRVSSLKWLGAHSIDYTEPCAHAACSRVSKNNNTTL